MAQVRKKQAPDEVVAARSPEEAARPVEIDLDDLEAARRDEEVGKLLELSEAEGALVEREGRQRW